MDGIKEVDKVMIDGCFDYAMPPANSRIFRVLVFTSSCPVLPGEHRHICNWAEQTGCVPIRLFNAGMTTIGDKADLLLPKPT